MVTLASLAATSLSVCLGVGACTRLPPAAPDQPRGIQAASVPLGGEFRLRDGETALVGKNDLLVRFDHVASDARCSVGSSCPDDGNAVVVISVRQPPNESVSVELHTGTGRAGEATYLQYRVRLVRLEPRPVGEQPVPLPHYVATLIVSGSEPEPGRGSATSLTDPRGFRQNVIGETSR